jgi:hypothetical protein
LVDYLQARQVTQLIDVEHTVDDYASFLGRPPASFLRERRRFHGEQGSDVIVWDVVLDSPGRGSD